MNEYTVERYSSPVWFERKLCVCVWVCEEFLSIHFEQRYFAKRCKKKENNKSPAPPWPSIPYVHLASIMHSYHHLSPSNV